MTGKRFLVNEVKRIKKRLRKTPVNQFLVGSVFVCFIIIAFLSGLLVSSSKKSDSSVKSKSIEISTPSPTPTPLPPAPQVKKEIIITPTPQKTSTQETKKLVPITIDMMSKTYYCYEDKVNELANLDYLVTISMNVGRGCMDSAGYAQSDCSSNCIEDSCFKKCLEDHENAIQKCIDDSPDYGNELLSKIGQYCP